MPTSQRFPVAIAGCLIALALASPSAAQDAGAFERGGTLTRWLLGGELDSLTAVLSQSFVDAIGGRSGLERLARQLHENAGAEQAVLREEAFREGGHTTYYRISRFEKIPDVSTRWVWDPDGMVVGATVTPSPQPAPSNYLDYVPRTQLQLPFRSPATSGAMWYVAWGGRDHVFNYHVGAPDQRFAYDFVVIRGDSLHTGDGSRNEDHFCFGEPIHAPGAGRIVAAVDSVSDNARPGVMNRDNPPGNHVVIDHGDGEYSLIAHLRQGSVVVGAGDMVSRGDVVGACGNSGNSSLPHLHYHLQTGAAYKDGFGLPVVFHAYFTAGRYVERGEPVRGQVLVPYAPRRR